MHHDRDGTHAVEKATEENDSNTCTNLQWTSFHESRLIVSYSDQPKRGCIKKRKNIRRKRISGIARRVNMGESEVKQSKFASRRRVARHALARPSFRLPRPQPKVPTRRRLPKTKAHTKQRATTRRAGSVTFFCPRIQPSCVNPSRCCVPCTNQNLNAATARSGT